MTEVVEPETRATLGVRSYLSNQLVYIVISQRAKGVSVGVNLNPDKVCNFDCAYCEIDPTPPTDRTNVTRKQGADVTVIAAELESMLRFLAEKDIRSLPGWANVPAELSKLKEVALSGDGEPTLCPNFEEAIQTVLHVRARGTVPFFKIVLITNGTGLHLPEVRRALKLLTSRDEIWVKLDVGTQAGLERLNRPVAGLGCPAPDLDQIINNIIQLGRERPVIIQSMFPRVDKLGPAEDEVAEYLNCLRRIKAEGAHISLVQVYSVHRPAVRSRCEHLSLKELSAIARSIRALGLKAEVF